MKRLLAKSGGHARFTGVELPDGAWIARTNSVCWN
jgi:hypothetical protein